MPPCTASSLLLKEWFYTVLPIVSMGHLLPIPPQFSVLPLLVATHHRTLVASRRAWHAFSSGTSWRHLFLRLWANVSNSFLPACEGRIGPAQFAPNSFQLFPKATWEQSRNPLTWPPCYLKHLFTTCNKAICSLRTNVHFG